MLTYTIFLQDPHGHYLDLELALPMPLAASLTDPSLGPQLQLALPAWIPGSYLVREFSRHVLHVQAHCAGQALPVHKTSKDHWQIDLAAVPNNSLSTSLSTSLSSAHAAPQQAQPTTPRPSTLHIRWRVYAWDLSVRGAHFDASHAFLNGAALFLYPVGGEHLPAQVHVHWPANAPLQGQAWTAACGLPLLAETAAEKTANHAAGQTTHTTPTYTPPTLSPGGTLSWSAPNHATLIDHPWELGQLHWGHFDVQGVPHHVAVYGADADVDLPRLCQDLAAICAGHASLFGHVSGNLPFASGYWFMVHATDAGHGGLEHRNSTALLCSRHDLPQLGVAKAPKGYEAFLGLCSHEYFHAWHVKRIQPAAFLPQHRLHQENYTELLWLFEGFTSYYDDLMLLRTQRITQAAYAHALGKTISQVRKGPAQAVHSVAESAWDAWIKYYRQDENAPNAVVSYYTKGALVALCLDALLQERSTGQHSLDDVMRALWQHRSVGVGVAERELPAMVQAATGLDVEKELNTWVHGREELPLDWALGVLGYTLEAVERDEAAALGLYGSFKAEGFAVRQVINGSPAHRAGIAAGDLLVALDNKRLGEAWLQRCIARWRAKATPGTAQAAMLMGFRADRLLHFNLETGALRVVEWKVSVGRAD